MFNPFPLIWNVILYLILLVNKELPSQKWNAFTTLNNIIFATFFFRNLVIKLILEKNTKYTLNIKKYCLSNNAALIFFDAVLI
jgi:hypothetical protein